MKRLVTALIAVLPLVASAGLLMHGPRHFVEPPAGVDTGSIVGTGTIDEVTDRIDILAEGQAVDVGGGDHAFGVWLRPHATANTEPLSDCDNGAGYDFPNTNIWLDRDNLGETRDFGCGLAGGRVCCSVENGNGSASIIGTTDITDAAWHFVLWQRNSTTGVMDLYVDGDRESQVMGPAGAIDLNPGTCAGAECYIVFLTEKHGFAVAGYVGSIGPIEIWSATQCSGLTCSVPSVPAAADATGLVGQFLLGEGSGTVVGDSTSNNNDGFIAAGGVPAWSQDTPYP